MLIHAALLLFFLGHTVSPVARALASWHLARYPGDGFSLA